MPATTFQVWRVGANEQMSAAKAKAAHVDRAELLQGIAGPGD